MIYHHNPDLKRYCIYYHLFPNGLMYIGKGTANRHYKVGGRNKYWNRAYADYGFPAVCLLGENLTEFQAFKAERISIQYFKRKGFNLLNIAPGREYEIKAYSRRMNTKKVYCYQNGQVYDSIKEAAKAFNVTNSTINRICQKVKKGCKNCEFDYLTNVTDFKIRPKYRTRYPGKSNPDNNK